MKAFIAWLLSLFGSKKKQVGPPKRKTRSILSRRIPKIQYKKDHQHLKDQHEQLKEHNPHLYDIVEDLNDMTYRKFKKTVIITMVFRTQKQQDYLYRNSKKYKKKPFKSPHQFWHAVDIRSRSFTQTEINEITAWLNKRCNDTNYYKWTAKAHNIGAGMHFHIQYVPK